jgi:hypothetical protein
MLSESELDYRLHRGNPIDRAALDDEGVLAALASDAAASNRACIGKDRRTRPGRPFTCGGGRRLGRQVPRWPLHHSSGLRRSQVERVSRACRLRCRRRRPRNLAGSPTRRRDSRRPAPASSHTWRTRSKPSGTLLRQRGCELHAAEGTDSPDSSPAVASPGG